MIFVLELRSCRYHKDKEGKSHPTSGDEVEVFRAEKPNDGVRRPGSVTRREFAFPWGWKVEEQKQKIERGWLLNWLDREVSRKENSIR